MKYIRGSNEFRSCSTSPYYYGTTILDCMEQTEGEGEDAVSLCKKDKSLDSRLCELWNDFVIYGDRAYDVYPW